MSFLEKNFAALRQVAPALADRIGAVPVPDGFERVNGTDGTPTFRRTVTTPDGKRRLDWLGATSMPRESAEPLVSSLDPTGGGGGIQNGLGLSIGTGYEWAAFAARLAPAQALYVYDPTPALRMALEICDLSALLAARKIVLITGNAQEAGDYLVRWLTENLGMDPPTVLHPLPTTGAGNSDARNALLAAGEAIVRQAVLHRQAQMESIHERLVLASAAGPQGTPQVLAFTITPRFPEERPLQAFLRGIPHESLTIDTPATTSLALRAERLASLLERGPVTVLSDLFRAHLGCVPATVRVETWIPPLIGPGFWSRISPAAEILSHDSIVVHADEHRSRLVSHGIPVAQIELRPLVSTGDSLQRFPANPLALRHRVALVGDLPRISLEALELTLPTHQAIHAAARDLLAQEFLTAHPGSIPDLLRRALARAGLTGAQAEDVLIREPMQRLVRDLLLPTVPVVELARTLLDAGIALTLVGDWPEWQSPAGKDVRLVPFNAPAEERWQGVALLVHLSPTGVVAPLIGDAIAHEIAIIAPEHPTDAAEGALAKLLTPGTEYLRGRPAQFLAAIKRLLADGPQRQKLADAAASRLFAAH